MKGEQKQEISMKDILVRILRSWRIVLLLTLVCAVAFSGVKLLIDLRNYSIEQTDSQDVSAEELEEVLTDTQLLAVKEAESLRSLIEQKEEYMENSFYFNMDPYQVHQVNLLYFVSVDNRINFSNGVISGDSGELAKAYAEAINANLYNILSETKSTYYKEVVRADAVEMSAFQFSVSVKASDEETVKALTEKVKTAIGEISSKMSLKIERHSLKLVDESYSVTIDEDLATKKETYIVSLNTTKKNLNTIVSAFTADQMEYYKIFDADVEEQEQVKEKNVSFSVKYLLIGAIIGVAIAVLYVLLSYMSSSKLRRPEELAQIYNTCLVGTLRASQKNKIFSCVDRFIDKHTQKENLTAQQQLAFCLSNLKMICKKADLKSIALVTDYILDETEKEYIDAICKGLSEQNITLTVCELIRKDLEAYEKAQKEGNAVLLEKVGVSSYSHIETTVAMCEQADIKLHGVIAVSR